MTELKNIYPSEETMELTERASELTMLEFQKQQKILDSLPREEAIKEMMKISNQIYQKVFEENEENQ